MNRLLHIVSSPRKENSESSRIATSFLNAYRELHPDATLDVLDLWNDPLPFFDGDKAAAAKMTVITGGILAGAEITAWEAVTAVFERFNRANHYLFSVPMWNGGIPWVLKQYIDIITQPGMLFGFDPAAGYIPLLTGKKAAVVYTSGVYAPGVPPAFGADFHSTYFDNWLRFHGVTDLSEIRFQPTLLSADRDGNRAVALRSAAELGRTF